MKQILVNMRDDYEGPTSKMSLLSDNADMAFNFQRGGSRSVCVAPGIM